MGDNDEMSYASTAGSDDGLVPLRVGTDSSVEYSPSTESASHFGSVWDLSLPESPAHTSLPWHTQDYYMSPHSTACMQQSRMMRNPITTTMLRNIPQRYDRDMLLETLNSTGFGGAFDFVYMPNDFSTGVNLGYAFINFVS